MVRPQLNMFNMDSQNKPSNSYFSAANFGFNEKAPRAVSKVSDI